jgi:hypothetical protein
MKYKPVHDIFKQSPEKHAPEKNTCDFDCRILEMGIAVKKEINYNGKINPPNNQGMSFSEHFQVVVPE